MPPGFQSRVNTNVVPVQARQGGSTGSAIAEGVAQLGQTLGRVADQDAQVQEGIADSEARISAEQRRREISAHSADRIGAWAQLQADIGNDLLDIRTRSKPGAVGHKEEAIKLVRDKMDGFLGTLAEEPEVRERFEPMLIEFEARTLLNEGEWELQKRAKHQGDSWASYVETTGNGLMNAAPDALPGQYQQMIMDGREALSLMDIDGTTRAALDDKLVASATEKLRDTMLQRGQVDQLERLVKSGFLNDKGLDLNRTLKMIDTEKRALQVAADQAASDARTEAREAVKAVEEKVKLGINPSQAEIAQVRRAAVANGLPEADIIGLDGLGIQIGLNRTYNEAADPMGIKASAAASRLGAKVAAGTATEAEQVGYTHLKGIGDSRAKARGAQLKETAKQGIAGQATVLSELRAMPAEQRFLAAEEAKPGLGQLALLGPRSQQYALEGREVRAARKDEFGKAEEVKAAFARRIGGVASSLGGEYDNIMGIAWDIYAGELNGRSASGWNEAQFDVAVKVALGATKRDNGVLQGGVGRVRGKQVILPDWKTPEEFDKTLSTLKFDGAVYANGEAASKADILSNYRPEYYAEDAAGQPLYRFIGPTGKALLHKDGSVYNLVVTR
jgi:hypothetical protein